MSLLRWRSMCKPCFSLTRYSTSFTCRHLSTETNNRLLISSFNKNSSEQHFLSATVHDGGTIGTPNHLFTLQTEYMGLEPSQNLNGLFCFRHSNLVHTYYSYNPIYICNPKTKEVVSLPQDEPLRIGYDESIIHVKYYFGFNPLTEQHKVLCVRLVRSNIGTEQEVIRLVCKIITLGTDSWREIDSFLPFDPHKDDFICEGVCVNGAIHWIAKKMKTIVAFDVGEEKFRAVPIPIGYDDDGTYRASIFDYQRMIQVGGCLALIDDKNVWGVPGNVPGNGMLELWMLDNYEKQVWIREGIDFPFRWVSSEWPIPVGAINTGEILLTVRNLGENQAWTLNYDMKKKSFRSDEINGLPNWVFSNGARIKFITAYEEPKGIEMVSVDQPQTQVPNEGKKENGSLTLDIGHDIFSR